MNPRFQLISRCWVHALLALLPFFVLSSLQADERNRVLEFSPQGVISDVTQVRARFSSDLAPFGDLKAVPDPFTVTCLPAAGVEANVPDGAGRWIDSSNWVYEFSSKLPEGVGCSFKLAARFTERLSKSGSPTTFSFSTEARANSSRLDPCKPQGPEVLSASPAFSVNEDEDSAEYPRPVISIDENQRFVLLLNCPVDSSSMAKAVFFEVEGMKDRVGVQVLEGAAREQTLAERSLAGRENAVVIKPRLNFPSGAQVTMVWGKGVRSKTGISRAEERRAQYNVRAPFSVSSRCSHTFSDGSCDPYLPIYAVFSAKVPNFAGGEYQYPFPIELRSLDGRIWKGQETIFREGDTNFTALKFNAPFPAMQDLTLSVPARLLDESGRLLENRGQLPLKVKVGKVPPMVKFNSIFGMVEHHAGAALPMTVRSVKAIDPNSGVLDTAVANITDPASVLTWLVAVQNRYVAIERNTTSIFSEPNSTVSVEKVKIQPPAGGEPFEVLGIPFKRPGFYILEVGSRSMGSDLIGPDKTLYVPTTALVTNLSVHMKLGKESSLAWVTALDTGRSVEGAEVSVRDCSGTELFQGRTGPDGILRIPALAPEWESRRCGLAQRYVDAPGVARAPVSDGVLMISARKGDDFSFVLSSWDEGLEPWRFGLYQDYSDSRPQVGHTILDRSLFRRGETVHMKPVVRIKSTSGFEYLGESQRPTELEIWHLGSGDRFSLPLSWKDNGTAEQSWRIPPDARMGEYNIYFKRADGAVDYRYTAAFSVLDYRVPLMRAVIVPPQQEVIMPPEVPLDVSVRYLAGGGAGNMPFRLRYQVQPENYSFEGNFEGYEFGREVESRRADRGWEYDSALEAAVYASPKQIKTVDGSLDEAGAARVLLTGIPKITRPSKLFTELEYRDPNGEIQTVSTRIPLLPSPYLVGIKTDSWAQSQSAFKFSVAVVTGRGSGAPNQPVEVRLLQREVYTHRKKLVGGTFAYENTLEDSDKGIVCRGTTDSKGILACNISVPLTGEFVLDASTIDMQGRKSSTASVVFVGRDDYWFAQENTDRMDLLPEKAEYQPGETARLQVRVPFKDSTALVTVEREGIVDAFVTNLSRSNPVIEIPIKANYGPNAFVSVLATRGRIDQAKPTAVFDPGKPAFRLGMTELRVGWQGYALKVGVKTERGVYKVRERVPVSISVRTPDGRLPPAGTEIALAAVDEGLLELKPNATWQILNEIMSRRGLMVRTFTAQMFVVGKRHFGLKALPFGGGGGKLTTRELFDTLLYWNPSLAVDEKGEARVEIPLNDSITSFKIVAVAIGGVGRFGTGATTVRSSKDFILFAGIPPVVRAGDKFSAEVTVRNATDRQSTVEVSLSGVGVQDGQAKSVEIAPGASQILNWPVVVPSDAGSAQYSATIIRDGTIEDSMRVSQRVMPVVPVRVQQGSLIQLNEPKSLPISAPNGAIEGSGGVRVSLSASIGGDTKALNEYMRQYPFSCLEQRLSKVVATRDSAGWQSINSEMLGYLDAEGFAKYFPSMERGDESLTSYLLAITHQAGWEVAEPARLKMIGALKRFIEGKTRPMDYQSLDLFQSEIAYRSKVYAAAELDLLLRRIVAIEALSRYQAIEPELVAALWPRLEHLPTIALVQLYSATNYLEALPARDARMRELEKLIRARLDLQGTQMQFRGEENEEFFWNMISSDLTSIRFVSTILSHKIAFERFSKDAGRLVRGMLGRQTQGRWDLTLANAWGALALEAAKDRLSATPPSGITNAAIGGESLALNWADADTKSQVLAWPKTSSGKLELKHSGEGAPWVTIESLAAVPRVEPITAGYKISKQIEPVQSKVPGQIHVGDIIKIRINVVAQGSRSWVVIDDPVPAGASILGSGHARDAALLNQTHSASTGGMPPSFEERTFEGYRAYFRELPRGEHVVEYLVRLNTPGEYLLPASRVEAMYSPEMFGEMPNASVVVLP